MDLSWKKLLEEEFEKLYFVKINQNIEKHYAENVCFPEKEKIFAAFEYCKFDALKVVIIGQDPYHGEGEAQGLSFSVPNHIKIPPSLRNIYRELSQDLDWVMMPSSGNLTSWAQQGVLLLNNTLTVEKNKPNSHKNWGWEKFTNQVISIISDKKENVVFLLWGQFAQSKSKLINPEKHLILCSGHPSPMSANQGKWFGNKHFSKTNTFLTEKGLDTISWDSVFL